MSRLEDPVRQHGASATREFRHVAIVGAATLKGRELKEVLEAREIPADIKLLDDEESLGQLESVADEATFIQSVLPENLQSAEVVFFASDENFTRRTWGAARSAGSKIVDLSYALENEPGAAVRSPWVERELEGAAGGAEPVQDDSKLVIVAHPAATILALLLLRAQNAGAIKNVVCTAFEPASEHGRRGMDELHNQTVSLLSFQQMPKDVFDTQLAFNMLGRYGEKSTPTLESVERRILAHLQAITAGRAGVPALALAQAPIFHGHVFSIYLEFEPVVAAGDLAHSLEGEHVTLAQLSEDSPSNVGAAGHDDVLVSFRRDLHHERGFWLWAAADNLRVAALNAADCASELLNIQPGEKVQ